MGTPSTEIVLNELVALNEVDPATRMRRSHFEPLTVIRVGTSGALQSNTSLGSVIITRYVVGLDNAASFYELPYSGDGCERLERSTRAVLDTVVAPSSRFRDTLSPYAAKADATIVSALERAATEHGVAYEVGVTVSAPGFFASQGRDISRLGVVVPDLDRHLSEAHTGLEGQRFLNMEMEASFLLAFLGGQGYRAGVVCAAVANRRSDTFADNMRGAVANAYRVALRALVADTQ
jgi:uridine phosphorylase